MANEFSVLLHTTFFAGYLDAVGRQYTDQTRTCVLAVHVMPTILLDGLSVRGATLVEKIVVEFERDISRFLATSPKDPLVFYLIEYFGWYKDFTDECWCEKLRLEGGDLSPDHFAYRLHLNHADEVMFLASWRRSPIMRNMSLECTHEG